MYGLGAVHTARLVPVDVQFDDRSRNAGDQCTGAAAGGVRPLRRQAGDGDERDEEGSHQG